MYKYCIFTMDWTSRISYIHIGQYYYMYMNSEFTNGTLVTDLCAVWHYFSHVVRVSCLFLLVTSLHIKFQL